MKKHARKLPVQDQSVVAPIDDVIHTIRGERIIMDADLARLYGVETRVLNQAVRRNRDKFPPDFLLELTRTEASNLQRARKQIDTILRSQIVTLKQGRHLKYRPFAFTEHGALMAANILNRASGRGRVAEIDIWRFRRRHSVVFFQLKPSVGHDPARQ